MSRPVRPARPVRPIDPVGRPVRRVRYLPAGALALLAAASGCAMMMASMTPKPRTAANPLVSGQPLEASKNARIGTVTEKDCDRWPFEDTVNVTVTEAQICVSARKHIEQPPGWSGEPTANSSEGFRISNDANEGGYINAEKAHASKVGSCFERGYNKQIGVWAFDYKGCAPNNGTVSKATKSLHVGDESWSFPGDAPPATTTAAGAQATAQER